MSAHLGDLAWLSLAIGSNPAFPEMNRVHGGMATDGFRQHYTAAIGPLCKCGDTIIHSQLARVWEAARREPILAVVTTAAFLDLAETVVAHCRAHNLPRLGLTFNESNLQAIVDPAGRTVAQIYGGVSLSSDGQIAAEVGYRLQRPAAGFAISLNPWFLRDALLGFDAEQTTIRCRMARGAIHLQAGSEREAIIKLMWSTARGRQDGRR